MKTMPAEKLSFCPFSKFRAGFDSVVELSGVRNRALHYITLWIFNVA